MGSSHSKQADDSTINWNNIKTANISSTIPSYNNLSKEAQTLVSNLGSNVLSESSSVNITELLDDIHSKLNIKDKNQFTNMLNEINNVSEAHNESLSATSPFMSKEDYNKYLNSTTSDNVFQQPGMKMTGGDIEDDSSTSSTSSLSSSSSDEISSSHKESKHKSEPKSKLKHKPVMKQKKQKKQHRGGSSEDDEYISSSAHTGGESSDQPSISPNTDDINSISSD